MKTIKHKQVIAVTGGAGFIGSSFLLTMVPKYPEYLFINVDALTYAGNLANLKQIEDETITDLKKQISLISSKCKNYSVGHPSVM